MAPFDFTGNLYRELNKASPNGNVFFSPYSISMAMSMVLHGSEGASKDQLVKGLGFENDSDVLQHQKKLLSSLNELNEGIQLKIANKIFPDLSFSLHQTFVDQLKEAIGCQVEGVNFCKNPGPARKIINDWVESATENKIKDLMPSDSITPDTRLVLVNAIYFKGMWKDQFKKNATKPEKFYCMDGLVKNVEMMTRKAKYLNNYNRGMKTQCLQLPYKGNTFSMCIFLPDDRLGLEEVEKKLTSDKMNEMLDTCGMEEVVVKLPKFKLEYEKMLNDTLKSLGIVDIFDGGKANLKRITDENLLVSHVAHKAFIEVNEEGTEAAAATGVAMMKRCMPLPPLEFTCDHPFIFTIRHNSSKEMLFFGKIASLGE